MSQSDILLESGTNELEIVEFHLDEVMPDGTTYRGYYGINVAKVLEIIRLPEITEMPNVPHPSVLGAFDLRNQVIPLIDLSKWLGKARNEEVGAPKVIVTEFIKVISAFLVSGVTRIYRLSWEQIEPPSQQVQYLSGSSITGVVKIENRVVFILDMEKVVQDLNPTLALKEEEAVEEYKKEEDTNHPAEISYKAVAADDSPSILKMVVTSLKRGGFEVTSAVNGAEAWDRLAEFKKMAADQNRPISDFVNLIVSDIEMPAMDGHNLTKRIKADPVLKQIPVVLFSSLISDSLRHKGEAVGADDQITKPDLPQLARRARELVNQHFGVQA